MEDFVQACWQTRGRDDRIIDVEFCEVISAQLVYGDHELAVCKDVDLLNLSSVAQFKVEASTYSLASVREHRHEIEICKSTSSINCGLSR